MANIGTKVVVLRETLSDGSHVFNVSVPSMLVACETEARAQDFAVKLAALCNEYNVHENIEAAFKY